MASSRGFSRRDFMKGSAVAAAAATGVLIVPWHVLGQGGSAERDLWDRAGGLRGPGAARNHGARGGVGWPQ